MTARVLVTYASKHGATAEIAEKIKSTLLQHGLFADILPADEVTNPAPYQAVVLGSAVYVGQWRRSAVRFLREHRQALAEKQVWIFSSGPTGKGDPESLLNGWTVPTNVKPVVEELHPRDVAVFGGTLSDGKMNFFEKWITRKVKAPVGDFRNWDAIEEWAQGIASDLKDSVAV
jgi:menaquinone-dependent protoporphyrinogen oxidase